MLRSCRLLACLLLVATSATAQLPGRADDGTTLLPNGWRIAPAGRHVQVGDLPLAMVESPDGRSLVVSNNGYDKPSVSVVDLERMTIPATLELDDAWLGLAWHPDGKRLWVSGGAANAVHELEVTPTGLRLRSSVRLRKAAETSFVGGLAVAPDGTRLYAVHALGKRVSAVDLRRRKVVAEAALAAEGYTALLSADGRTLFVSLWGGARVLLFEAATLRPRGEIEVGEHPNAMALSRDGRRLFVACANTNQVWIVDLEARAASERISIALDPAAPPGSTPNSLGLSPDGGTLLVANADNNSVAVVDVARPGASAVRGFIPTGWYPTAAQFSRDGKRIFVLSAKGLRSAANPHGPNPGRPPARGQYIAELLPGTLSVLDVPDDEALAAYTRTVHRLTSATAADPAAGATGGAAASALPETVGGPSPVRYVFYIVRENRTYDQILGDVTEGNGDPGLCLFGEEVTPNAHALAREFVLFDNFYVNAEVSYNGHSYSMAAYSTDFTEKVWPMNYAGRGGDYLIGEKGERRNAYGNITAPQNGFLWDFAARGGVSVRSYGEFAVPVHGTSEHAVPPFEAAAPGLEGKVSPDYPPFDVAIPDARRVDAWLAEFQRFEASGELPRLSILHLPGDHTAGTRPGYRTPRAMVAENDEALGRIVEAISHSRFWPESAVFVVEDDAQNGPDHVDAHRSVLLVASPYARRAAVDRTLYTTAGVLRTIELVLGLPAMSQYDAAAIPLRAALQATPDARPFRARPARVDVDERNATSAWGARASLAMNLAHPDRAPDRLLNEIVWRSVRGAKSPMPEPVHAGFVRALKADADADD